MKRTRSSHLVEMHEMAFPLLGNIAKRYLHVCAPATSTCSERVFGKGGDVL